MCFAAGTVPAAGAAPTDPRPARLCTTGPACRSRGGIWRWRRPWTGPRAAPGIRAAGRLPAGEVERVAGQGAPAPAAAAVGSQLSTGLGTCSRGGMGASVPGAAGGRPEARQQAIGMRQLHCVCPFDGRRWPADSAVAVLRVHVHEGQKIRMTSWDLLWMEKGGASWLKENLRMAPELDCFVDPEGEVDAATPASCGRLHQPLLDLFLLAAVVALADRLVCMRRASLSCLPQACARGQGGLCQTRGSALGGVEPRRRTPTPSPLPLPHRASADLEECDGRRAAHVAARIQHALQVIVHGRAIGRLACWRRRRRRPSALAQDPGSRPRSASSCCRRATSLSRAARRSFCFFLQRLGGGWSGGRSTWLDVSYVLSFSKNIVPLFMLRPKGSYDKCAASQLLERVQCCTALPCK